MRSDSEHHSRADVVWLAGAAGGVGTTSTALLAAKRTADRGGIAVVVDPRGDLAQPYGPRRGLHSVFRGIRRDAQRTAPPTTVAEFLYEIAPGVHMLTNPWRPAGWDPRLEGGLPPAHALAAVVDGAAAHATTVIVDLGTHLTAKAHGWLDVAPASERVVVARDTMPGIGRCCMILDEGDAARCVLYRGPQGVITAGELAARSGISVTAIDRSPDTAWLAESSQLLQADSLREAAALDPLVAVEQQRVDAGIDPAGL